MVLSVRWGNEHSHRNRQTDIYKGLWYSCWWPSVLSDHNNWSHNELGTETHGMPQKPSGKVDCAGEGEKQYQRAGPAPSCLSLLTSLGPGTWLMPWKLLKCIYRDSRGHWADRYLGPVHLQPLPLTWADRVPVSVPTRRLKALWQVELSKRGWQRLSPTRAPSVVCEWDKCLIGSHFPVALCRFSQFTCVFF